MSNWRPTLYDEAAGKPQLSCPPSAVIVQCDRALERNARGTKIARYKKIGDHRVAQIFSFPRVLSPQNRMHIALSPCWAGSGADASHHQRLLLHRFHLLLQHLHLAFPVVAAAKPGEVDGKGGGGPAAGRSPESPKQIQLNTVGCPSRHARAKEVGILRPHRATNRHCAGKYRPVLGIP